MNPGISGLGVEYKNGVVSISGQAASAEAMEKAVLMAGNVQGVSDVKIDNLQTPANQEKVEYYLIKKGETLSAIAKQFYGKANQYRKIFEANREVIKDPNLIFPGQKIRIRWTDGIKMHRSGPLKFWSDSDDDYLLTGLDHRKGRES